MTTTASTGSAKPGVPYTFNWKTTADNKIKYSNCGYTGDSVMAANITVTSDKCATLCAASSSCSYFSWIGYGCYFSKPGAQNSPSLPKTLSSAEGGAGVCGYKVTSG